MSDDAITQIAKIINPDFDYDSDAVQADMRALALECFSVVLPSTMEILSEREALRAENEKLRAALKPFAEMHDKWWAGGVMFLPMPDEHTVPVEFIHLRAAAAAALKETDG